MKVSTQEIEQRQMVLEIEVDQERVDRALEQAYKRIVNRINVPGFRRGRAPRPLVERMVGRAAILEDAVDHLVPQVYQDALKEHQINPAGQPALEVTSTEPLQFKATVPLQPKVELGDYKSIDIPLEPVTVEDEEVDAVVQNLRESNSTWAPVERAVQVGDRVAIDVKATRGELTIIDSKDAEFVVNSQGPEPVHGFSDQLIGMEAGEERTFSLGGGESPEGEEGAEAGPTEATTFTVGLKWVKEKQLPELDEEFARTIGEQETVEQLRDEIRDQIKRHKEREGRERQHESIMQAAVDQTQIEMPPQLIDREANRRIENLAASLDKQGISVEQYLQFTGKDVSSFRTELRSDAEQSLKQSLVLDAIAGAEGLQLSDDEVQAEIDSIAQGSGDRSKATRQALSRPEARAGIEAILLRRKALNRLIELAGGEATESSTLTEVAQASGESND